MTKNSKVATQSLHNQSVTTSDADKKITRLKKNDTTLTNETFALIEKRKGLTAKVNRLMKEYEALMERHEGYQNRLKLIFQPIKDRFNSLPSDIDTGISHYHSRDGGCNSENSNDTHIYIQGNNYSPGACALNGEVDPTVNPNFCYGLYESYDEEYPKKSLMIAEDGTVGYQVCPKTSPNESFEYYQNRLGTQYNPNYDQIHLIGKSQPDRIQFYESNQIINNGVGSFARDGEGNGYILTWCSEENMNQGNTNGVYCREPLVRKPDKNGICKNELDWLAWEELTNYQPLSDVALEKTKQSSITHNRCTDLPPFSKGIPTQMQREIKGLISEISSLASNIKSTISEIDTIDTQLSMYSGSRSSLLDEKSILLKTLEHVINVGSIYADRHTIEGQHETMFLGQRSNYLHLIGWCILFVILLAIFIYLTMKPSALLSKYVVIIIIIYIVITLLVMLWNYLYSLNLV
tara:strand:+ start:451 stop:1839 length:1389 start_codon:yes stop_codon:yes gene_type:complete